MLGQVRAVLEKVFKPLASGAVSLVSGLLETLVVIASVVVFEIAATA